MLDDQARTCEPEPDRRAGLPRVGRKGRANGLAYDPTYVRLGMCAITNESTRKNLHVSIGVSERVSDPQAHDMPPCYVRYMIRGTHHCHSRNVSRYRLSYPVVRGLLVGE